MQIHELNNFAGTPTSSDYLAIDNSTTTTKIGATDLGVQDQLTVAEAETGTSTASRIVTPKVVHDYVTGEVSDGIDNILTSATETKWASITGGDGTIDDALDYSADMFTGVQITPAPTITMTTGTTYSCTAYKYGKFIELKVEANRNATTSAGSNSFQGTLDDSTLYPREMVQTVTFNGSNAIVGQMASNGQITFRVLIGSIGASISPICVFRYLIA